jgi:hypothetical protein
MDETTTTMKTLKDAFIIASGWWAWAVFALPNLAGHRSTVLCVLLVLATVVFVALNIIIDHGAQK